MSDAKNLRIGEILGALLLFVLLLTVAPLEAANKFVWSGAGGANDGSSWENAYTSLCRDWGVEGTFTSSTDFVYVRSIHAQSQATACSIVGETTGVAAVRILSVAGAATGTTPGALTTGARVTVTGTVDINFTERLWIYGVEFLSDDDIFIASSSVGGSIDCESCRLELTDTISAAKTISIGLSSTSAIRLRLVNSTLDFARAEQGITLSQGTLEILGGSLALNLDNFLELVPVRPVSVRIRDFDASILTGALILGGSFNVDSRYEIYRVRLGTGASIMSGVIDEPGVILDASYTEIGTSSAPSLQLHYETYNGRATFDTARYRNSGDNHDTSDGTTKFSMLLDTGTPGTITSYHEPFRGPAIPFFLTGDGSSDTVRFYLASGATQQNDDFWMECEIQSSANTSSLGEIVSTRMAPLGTPTNLTTDSGSTWTCSDDCATKQYVDVTVAPDKSGLASCTPVLGLDGETIHLNTRPHIIP